MNTVEEELKKFFEIIEGKYKIEKGTIWGEWVNTTIITPPQHLISHPTTTKIEEGVGVKPKDIQLKKSNYQVFFSIQRNKLMKENPNMTFGEISKMVSSMWKQVPPEEKKTYVQSENDQFLHLSMKDLKKLCKEKDIDCKNMKREEMIESLGEAIKDVKPIEILPTTTTKISTPSTTNSVKISSPPLHPFLSSSEPSGRTKVEIALEDEDDFFFEEELHSEGGIDEDDDVDLDEDGDLDDIEESDIFADGED